MPGREDIKIRRVTTLYDLLDDGIENGSDLAKIADLKRDSLEERPERLNSPPNDARSANSSPDGRRSWFGILLGLALSVAGASVALWPSSMMVWHHRIMYLPSVVEYVTASTARGYGIVVAIAGICIAVGFLVRLRAPLPRT